MRVKEGLQTDEAGDEKKLFSNKMGKKEKRKKKTVYRLDSDLLGHSGVFLHCTLNIVSGMSLYSITQNNFTKIIRNESRIRRGACVCDERGLKFHSLSCTREVE